MSRKVALLLSVALVATLPACGTGEASLSAADVAETTAPLPVEVAEPEVRDVFETFATTTTIAADAEAPVLARVSGEVVELLSEEGDRVEEGQILARLDDNRLRLQMLQVKASLEMKQREYARALRLQERGLVSASALDGLKYDVDALTASYELMRLDHGYTKIRAPISGVVSARYIKPGAHIESGSEAFKITETSRLVAYLHIPQIELARIQAGDEADVQADAVPGRDFRATIARVSPTVDVRNGTFRATLYIDNSGGLLAPGMFSRFRIAFARHADALVVPGKAIVREDDAHVVYVVEDGAAARRMVTVGIVDGSVTEILDGLSAGDRVIVIGQARVRDGSKVLAANGAGSSFSG